MIYKWRDGQTKIETGDFLGEMTDELDGDLIVEFVSGGPKNYAYQTEKGKTECKVRGFTLNVRGKEVLNYDTMKAPMPWTPTRMAWCQSKPVLGRASMVGLPADAVSADHPTCTWGETSMKWNSSQRSLKKGLEDGAKQWLDF